MSKRGMGGVLLLGLAAACHRSTGSSSSPSGLADVVGVSVSSDPGAYQFRVTIRSPDHGCQQYAQSWEIVDAAGRSLFYRRILMHSHVDEQPFSRSGGPVAITADQPVVVRSLMSPQGYGGQAMGGTVKGGFLPIELPAGFGAALAHAGPQAELCAF